MEEKPIVKSWIKNMVVHGNTCTLTIPALARRALGLHQWAPMVLDLYQDHLTITPLEVVRKKGDSSQDRVPLQPKRTWRKGALTQGPERGGLPLVEVEPREE
jgi:hypothetical protein